MTPDELCSASLSDVSDRLARGEVGAVELTRAVLDRIARLNPTLHCYLTVTAEHALAAAEARDAETARGARRGPLHGVPIGIKDLCATRGIATTCASGVLEGWRPDHDAGVVRKLDAAGAVCVGKLNLTEFALMGYHPSLPRPRNPWDLSRDTGGSSSGSGAAVAAGLCFGAIGTDTGGSIRLPSSWCGVVGLKPTYGRVSRAGVFALGASLDHIGPMTRRVADAALMLDAMAGFDPDDPTTLRGPAPQCADAIGRDVRGLRIGWDAQFVAGGAQHEVVDAVRAALGVLAAQGAEIVEMSLPPVTKLLAAWPVLCAAEAAVAHAETFPSRAADYGPTFRSFLEYAGTLRAQDYAGWHEARMAWAGRLRHTFETIDLLACPSTFMTAPPSTLIDPVGMFTPDIAPFMRFTAPFNFSGSPTLSVPCGFNADRLPHSLQLVGRHGEEALLCQVGHAYEQVTEWHTVRPAL
jgi:amidase